MKKTILITLSILCQFTITGAEEIASLPLPPISLKQEKSLQKELKNDSKAEVVEEKKNSNEIPAGLAIERINLGISKDEGELFLPLATTLCLFMNKDNNRACRLKEYKNSSDALIGLVNGDIDFLITNSLVLGGLSGNINKLERDKIRFVNNFFEEGFFAFSRKDSFITNLKDLQGKNINLSSQKAQIIANEIMIRFGLQASNFSNLKDLTAENQIQALCKGTIDVAIFVAESMNDKIKNMTRACEINLVHFSDEELSLITRNPGYVSYSVPGGTYLGLPNDSKILGIKTVTLALADLPQRKLDFFIKNIMRHLPDIQGLHPAFKTFNLDSLFEQPVTAEHQAIVTFKKSLQDKKNS